MKGITPVIAVILLLLITISMVGFAFVWFSRVAQTATEQTEKQLQSELSRQNKKVAIDNIQLSTDAATGCVTLRNIGTAPIAKGELKLYVGGAAQAGCDNLVLATGATGSCSITAKSCNAGSSSVARVTSPGNQDQVTCTTQAAGSCAGSSSSSSSSSSGGPAPPPPPVG